MKIQTSQTPTIIPERSLEGSGKTTQSDNNADESAKLKGVAKDFESIFVGIMLKSMRDSVQKSGLLDGGNGEDIFRELLDQEYSKSISAQGDSSIATAIEREMKSLLSSNSQDKKTAVKAYEKVQTSETQK
jgi:flagellar protein FlgJ